MKTFKKVKKEYECKELDLYTCDICGIDISEDSLGSGQDLFSRYLTGADAVVTVEAEVMYSCGDGGSKETVNTDMCARCFITKAVPALEAIGAVFRKEEVDW